MCSIIIIYTGNSTGYSHPLQHTPHFDYNDPQFDFIMFQVVCPVLYCLITIIGIAGNSIVIYVIIARNNMRTITNLLLLNLAMADIAFVMICPPLTAYQKATTNWPFGEILCKLMHYVINVTVYVTIYTLVLIAAIRYMTIVHNQKTVKIRTRGNVVIIMACIWAIMLVVNIPILLTYGEVYFPTDLKTDCESYDELSVNIIFGTLFVCGYILPLLTIASLSIAIIIHIREQQSTLVDIRPQSRNRKRNASRLLILVIVIFAICWLPLHIILLWAHFGNIPTTKTFAALSIFVNPLAYFNSCVNPFIYNYYSKDFKDAFRDVMCFCRRRDEDDCLQMRAVGRSSMATKQTSPQPNGKIVHLNIEQNGKHLDVTTGLISNQETEMETIDMHAPGEIYIGEIKKEEFEHRKMSYDRKDSCVL